jgi:hypothetical protein
VVPRKRDFFFWVLVTGNWVLGAGYWFIHIKNYSAIHAAAN